MTTMLTLDTVKARIAAATAPVLRLFRGRLQRLQFAADGESFPRPKPRDFAGLKVMVENPAGSTRSGVSKRGKAWSVTMQHDYGYVARTKGADGEGLDVFLGPDETAPNAYIVHQNDPETGAYDEDKCMIGFPDEDAAKSAYLANYDTPDFFRSMTSMPIDRFREMLSGGEAGGVRWKRKHGREHATGAMFAADDERSGGRWITIGGDTEERGGKTVHHAGGTPVYIGKGGKIEKGPAALTGRSLDDLKKHPAYDQHTGRPLGHPEHPDTPKDPHPLTSPSPGAPVAAAGDVRQRINERLAQAAQLPAPAPQVPTSGAKVLTHADGSKYEFKFSPTTGKAAWRKFTANGRVAGSGIVTREQAAGLIRNAAAQGYADPDQHTPVAGTGANPAVTPAIRPADEVAQAIERGEVIPDHELEAHEHLQGPAMMKRHELEAKAREDAQQQAAQEKQDAGIRATLEWARQKAAQQGGGSAVKPPQPVEQPVKPVAEPDGAGEQKPGDELPEESVLAGAQAHEGSVPEPDDAPPNVEPIRASRQLDLMGNEVGDLTGKQRDLFAPAHEPRQATPTGGPAIKASANALDPKNTSEMFPATPSTGLTAEQQAAYEKFNREHPIIPGGHNDPAAPDETLASRAQAARDKQTRLGNAAEAKIDRAEQQRLGAPVTPETAAKTVDTPAIAALKQKMAAVDLGKQVKARTTQIMAGGRVPFSQAVAQAKQELGITGGTSKADPYRKAETPSPQPQEREIDASRQDVKNPVPDDAAPRAAASPATPDPDPKNGDTPAPQAGNAAREVRGKGEPAAVPRDEIRRRLLDWHESTGGAVPQDAHVFAESLQNPFTFHRNSPYRGEINDMLRDGGKEGTAMARSGAIRFTDEAQHSGGEDAINAFKDRYGPKGEDLYWRLARERAGLGWKDALSAAHESDDPETKWLAALHDATPTRKGERSPQDAVSPSALPMDHEFTVHGVPVKVTEDEDGQKILQDGTTLPETPVEALDKVPVDKGSLHPVDLPDVSGEDPFGDIPPDGIDEPAEDENESPRERVKRKARAGHDAEYAFARDSAVPNAGADLLGSARHKVNAWRGLEDAEKSGTAAEHVTRDALLRHEPHALTSSIGPENALSHLAAHLALNSLPKDPGLQYKSAAHPPEQRRKQFYDAFKTLKDEAERAARQETDPNKVLERFNTATKKLIQQYRGQSGDTMMAQVSATDRHNPVANALVDTYNRTRPILNARFRAGATSVAGRMQDFMSRMQKAYGDSSPETLAKAAEHAKDVMEGDSFNKTFGTVEGGKKGFDAAQAYVKHATRKGGRVIDASTVKAGTDFAINNLKMRGLQWGNSVSDDERQHHLQRANESFADLADILGIPDEMTSWGGKLGLAIGARGHGTAMAHYEPGTHVINLTRKNGVGSLAHEWGHMLDHMLGGGGISHGESKSGGDYMSEHLSPHRFVKDGKGWKTNERGQMVTEDRSKEPTWAAMDGVRKAFNSSGFSKRLSSALSDSIRNGELSKGKAQYWGSTPEKFARAFERHVQQKLAGAGRENTYLSGVEKHPFWPTDEEVAHMAPAFDALIDAAKSHYASAVTPPTSPSSEQSS